MAQEKKKVKMIPLEEAQKLYYTDARNILNWAKKGHITVSRISGSWWVDHYSVLDRIKQNMRVAEFEDYKETELLAKYKELFSLLAKYDDYMFFLRSFWSVAPLFEIMINEIALFIPKANRRKLFIDISMGGNIAKIAEEHNISYDKACLTYSKIINRLLCKTGFLKNYRQIIGHLSNKIKQLELSNNNLTEQVKTAGIVLKAKETFEIMDEVPIEVVSVLSKNFDDLGLDTRTRNALRQNRLETMEDLFRFLKNKGFEGMDDFRNFGKVSLAQLKEKLTECGFIDKNGDIELLKYVK